MESPKAFFRLLQADHRRFHRIFADRLREVGFDVRRVRRREFKNVWEAYVRRGSVTPGMEHEMLSQAICHALNSLGVKCPLRDVDFFQRGDRMTAAFFFDKGAVGTLCYLQGQEKWCAAPWP